ncbi:YhbY family RNA-binding protein [Ferroglobus sp.]|uniref:YhbY family RNA-binding protein n=1 Tax=Ferroglobus sp. TaxID=2614230 RepID=UPI0025C0C73F|nr:YhbY family RNA-binding protein [Ferroglobus sp.]
MKVVTINIGKKGITDEVIKEINATLEKKGIVKVRMLKNFRNFTAGGKHKKEIAQEISSKVNGKLIDFRGFVLTFKRC